MLGKPGLPTGCFELTDYETGEAVFTPGSHLYVFSDGVYEVRLPDDTMGTYDQFVQTLRTAPTAAAVIANVRSFQQNDAFDDDVSLVKIGR